MSENISDEKKEKFISSLDHNDYKRISRFLTQLLYQAEEDTKAELYGKIYRYRLLDLIDNDMMLRLSLVVSKSFVSDLSHLQDYIEEHESDDYIKDNLLALGLLKDCGNVFDNDGNGSIYLEDKKYILNEIGHNLLCIIQNQL